MATVAGAARPPGRTNAAVVTVSRTVRKYSQYHVRGVLEGPGRGTTAVQRRGGFGLMTAILPVSAAVLLIFVWWWWWWDSSFGSAGVCVLLNRADPFVRFTDRQFCSLTETFAALLRWCWEVTTTACNAWRNSKANEVDRIDQTRILIGSAQELAHILRTKIVEIGWSSCETRL